MKPNAVREKPEPDSGNPRRPDQDKRGPLGGPSNRGRARMVKPVFRKRDQQLEQLLEAREQQQQLIAYEIHDGLAQLLAGVSMYLQAYRELQTSRPDEARQAFDCGMHLLAQSIEETQQLIAGMRPATLDQYGVKAAIQGLVDQVRRHGGPEIVFESRLRCDHLEPAVQHAVFRIVQEAVNNACHHSKTEQVRIDLSRRKSGDLHVTIRDWGIGFDVNSARDGSHGLSSMRERARLLGGQIVIDTAPGRGTLIDVDLPLKNGHAAR